MERKPRDRRWSEIIFKILDCFAVITIHHGPYMCFAGSCLTVCKDRGVEAFEEGSHRIGTHFLVDIRLLSGWWQYSIDGIYFIFEFELIGASLVFHGRDAIVQIIIGGLF